MDASRENLSSKLMHQDKTFLQNGCVKSLFFTKFRKRIILFFKVSLHVIKVSLLMWFSLSLITSQSKLSLNSANAADQWKDPFLVFSPWARIALMIKMRRRRILLRTILVVFSSGTIWWGGPPRPRRFLSILDRDRCFSGGVEGIWTNLALSFGTAILSFEKIVAPHVGPRKDKSVFFYSPK